MTQWFIAFVLANGNVFSPGMQMVSDHAECIKIGDAYIEQMKSNGYDDDSKSQWADYHCIELPYNGKL